MMDLKKAAAILGLSSHATAVEIKQAYRLKVKENHPDLAAGNPSLSKIFEDRMKEINAAYDYMRMEARRRPVPSDQKANGSTKAPENIRPKKETDAGQKGSFSTRRPFTSEAPPQKGPIPSHGEKSSPPPYDHFFTNLIKTILDRLNRLTKSPDSFTLGQKKRARNVHSTYSEKPKEFSEILNEMLKQQEKMKEKRVGGEKLREAYAYYSTQQNRRKKSGLIEKGPVESIAPVSRIKKIEGD